MRHKEILRMNGRKLIETLDLILGAQLKIQIMRMAGAEC